MPTSDLTSLVPPQFSLSAASEEIWHRSSFFLSFVLFPIPGVECDLLLAFKHNSLLATFSNMFAG